MVHREPSFSPHRVFLAALVLFCLAASSRPAVAGVGFWTPQGPDGGTIVSLAVHPRNAQIVYAASEANGVFRSTDAGQSWISSSEGMGLTGVGRVFYAVKVDPQQPTTVYAVGFQDLWKSTDGGLTWVARLRKPTVSYHFTSLAIDPRNSRRLYLGTTTGILRSLNGGVSWQSLQLGTGLLTVSALAVDPGLGWIYAGTEGRGLLLSQDGGGHWTKLTRTLPAGASYLALEAATYRGRPLLFAATYQHGVLRSEDRGQHWVRVGGQTVAGSPSSLAFDGRTGRLYVGTLGYGVWAGTDRGSTWRAASDGLTDRLVTTLAVGPASTIYAGLRTYSRPESLFRSSDGGSHWQVSERGLSALYVSALAASPDVPGLLLAAADGDSLLRRGSGGPGASWQVVVAGEPAPLEVLGLAFDPAVPATVYASGQRSGQPGIAAVFLQSDDRGLTWQAKPADRAFVRLWVDPGTGTIWGAGPGLYRSDDHGVTWAAQPLAGEGPFDVYVNDIVGDPRDADVRYAAGWQQTSFRPVAFAPRLYRSSDRGLTWQRKDAGLATNQVRRIVVDPDDSAVLYAVAAGGLFRSRDRGDSWESFLSLPTAFPAALVIAPTAPRAFLLATDRPDSGVLVSRDEGESWIPRNAGLGDWRTLTDLVLDPFDETRVYAATTNAGVFSFELP
jgi:photosystem II stability/assembly factor-like uncharacterized protein